MFIGALKDFPEEQQHESKKAFATGCSLLFKAYYKCDKLKLG